MKKRKKRLEYVPGAADDGLGFFPAITCQKAGKVLWVVLQRRRQLPAKQEALAAAEGELALAFRDPSLPADSARFLDHLHRRGFSELSGHRVAKSFEEDRRSVLGADYEPAFGEAAARHDPLLHATIMKMVDQQLAENDPPETRETFDRLLAAGHSPEHVRRLIGLLLALELTESSILRRTPFDMKRYIENLRRLPEVPSL